MKKILKILTIVVMVGLLFFVGVGFSDNNNEVNYKGLVFSGVSSVNADTPCIPPPPGLPNNCNL